MIESDKQDAANSIAIIGMSGRFPGARNVEEFWRNLKDGVESIQFFSDEELTEAGVDAAQLRRSDYVRAAGVLEGAELFDAAFFGFNPREAEIMDPQQRIFIEAAWEALEDAGYVGEVYEGLIGIFAGSSLSTYLLNNLQHHRETLDLVGPYQVILSNDKDHVTTRASYKLNLRGPSVSIQTACSTSLVAVCTACTSLLDHQCDVALAGGISIKVPQNTGYLYQEGGIGSPDGHCRPFDAKAKGTVSGNGLGLVVLKRLSDALADGDSIRAVIKGWAINNDGSGKVGYTAPALEGQAEVIAFAQAVSNVDPETISYIETHGTGTSLGDPIEIAALTQAFRAATSKKNFCAIGSVKSNIGHLDPAAGVAGLIKTVLCLEHKLLPPSLHFEEPNPAIDFANSPFYVNDKLSSWETSDTPRRAAVSSFGIGGTNSHVVLEEAPEVGPIDSLKSEHLLCISARSEASLENATANLLDHLKRHPGINPADLAYTCHVGRKAFNHRRTLVCNDQNNCITALETHDPKVVLTGHEATDRPIVFLFPGQGSQYVRMAGGLYETEATFRTEVDSCSEQLKQQFGFDLRELLYAQSLDSQEAARQLKQTAIAQPALFVIEYALAKLWIQWGLHPQSMMGHSIGEYVAACLAGVFSLEDSLRLVAERGRLMQQTSPGAMLSVPMSEKDVRRFLNGTLDVAAANAPAHCVVSGPCEDIELLKAQLASDGFVSRQLETSHAFHSSLMDPVREPFAECLKRVAMHPPQIPFVSNVTGAWITDEQAMNIDYWTTHLRQQVKWAVGLDRIIEKPKLILLEVGPGQTLTTLASMQLGKTTEHMVIPSLRQASERTSDRAFLLKTLGRLWLSGTEINWSEFHADERNRRIPLPTYPFERKRYWLEPAKTVTTASPSEPVGAPQISSSAAQSVNDWFYVPTWKPAGALAQMAQVSAPPNRSNWLIFADEHRIGLTLAEQLMSVGHRAVVIESGSYFNRRDENVFTINPQSQSDYSRLVQELSNDKLLPQKIVHLWSVTAGGTGESRPAFYEECQYRGFRSLLFLAQALGGLTPPQPVQMVVVSNGLHHVNGDGQLNPEKATLLGPCRVIPQEYPHIACRSVDIAIPTALDGQTVEIYARNLIGEFAIESADPIVAYSQGQRLVQIYEPAKHENSADVPPVLRREGVYLITGGLGGIGLTLAQYLASEFDARLVLVGRSAPENLTSPDDNQKVKAIQALESAGKQVMVLRADVSDREQMQDVIQKIRDRFGELHGVIHAAGVPGGGLIQLRTTEMADRVFAPKIRGALVLRELLMNEKLDFNLLCSSLSSIGGGVGQVDYCAANAFLDAFAYSENDRGATTISVNWPTWREVGMAVDTATPPGMEESKREAISHGILSQEGVEVFKQVLSDPRPQVAIVPPVLLAPQPVPASSSRPVPTTQAGERGGPIPAATQRQVDSTFVAPGNEVEKRIADIWQSVLAIEPIGVNDNFLELGGHSLLAIQINSRLREVYSVELTLDLFFNSPTVAGLANAIEELLIKKIEDLPDSDVQDLLQKRS